MLDRPKVDDRLLITQINANYDIEVFALEFLPVGNDARAWSYRVETKDAAYFLKLRKGAPNVAALQVPHLLQRLAIQAVAPIPSTAGKLSIRLDDYALILYPYIKGKSGWSTVLTREQWTAWGATVRRIHEVAVEETLRSIAAREVFRVKWLPTINEIESVLARDSFRSEIASALAGIWQGHAQVVEASRQRYLALGNWLEAQSPPFVLCHADIHAANIIVDEHDGIHIIDWDETLLAPKERDLMFFIGDGHALESETAFLRGYGACEIDPIALAYYRYDWVMQELADYGERVLLASEASERELLFALDEFERLFANGDVVERAHQAYARIKASLRKQLMA